MSSGSKARSENESDFFLTAINGWNESLAETFNKQLITKIGIMNAFPQELLPTLQPTDVKPIDVSQVTTSLKDLAAAGAPLFPNMDLLNQILDIVCCVYVVCSITSYLPCLCYITFGHVVYHIV